MPTRPTPSAAPRPRRRDCCGAPIISAPGNSSGAQQAAFFLAQARPGPRTLLALDLEANENNPSNSMTLEQGEAFVARVAEATGRLPVVYVHPTWANGEPLPNSGLSLGAAITPASILARCGLWVADYHDSPEVPLAWAASGWRLWQYAGDETRGPPGLWPDQHRARRQPLRPQPVQRRRRRAPSVLGCGRRLLNQGTDWA